MLAGGPKTLPLTGVDSPCRHPDGHLVALGNDVGDLDAVLAER
jgi:hypothetical protein